MADFWSTLDAIYRLGTRLFQTAVVLGLLVGIYLAYQQERPPPFESLTIVRGRLQESSLRSAGRASPESLLLELSAEDGASIISIRTTAGNAPAQLDQVNNRVGATVEAWVKPGTDKSPDTYAYQIGIDETLLLDYQYYRAQGTGNWTLLLWILTPAAIILLFCLGRIWWRGL